MTTDDVSLQINPRPELDRFETYQAGLPIEQIKQQYGLKDVIKLASNENAYGSSPKALSAYKKAAARLFRYPESRSVDLRGVVADKCRVDIAQVIIGAGSDEIIELLAKAYLTPKDEIIMSAASFVQYRSAGNLMGARVVEVPMKNMKHDLMGMAAVVSERTKLIFVANPNNPTGTYNTKDEVAEFLDALPNHVLPVFDEAYFEYASVQKDYPSMIDEFVRKRPVLVLRTFSKIYGLAGLRVGYGVGPESCIETLDKIRPPFNVSVPSQVAAHAALFDSGFVKKSVRMNEQERKKIVKTLTDMGFPVVPSVTNFYLMNVRPFSGRNFFRRLLQKGIIARSVDEYGLPEYLRVTVGKPSENKKFLKILQEVIGKK